MSNLESRSHDLFTQIIEKPASQWPTLLDVHCESPELRSMVQRLLDQHVRSGDFLDQPATVAYASLFGSHGEQIAEFRIIRQIGKGGMGLVYLAEDTILKRPVALKIVGKSNSDNSDAIERFRREAQAAARLSHPSVVQIYRTGEEHGVCFIAMEYVDGETLRERLQSDKQRHGESSAQKRFIEAAKIVSQVADALEHAHRASVIHRDVKPSNILLDKDGNARLSDFGIARITTETLATNTGTIIGSFAYMSPEQARVSRVNIDHRTDVFSLGVVLYEAVCFQRPFDGSNPNEIFASLAEGRPAYLKKICPSVPIDLATICHKAIERDIEHRYQTAAHMSADLRCFMEGRSILARPPSIARRVLTWTSDRKQSLLITSVCLLSLALAGLIAAFIAARHAAMGRLIISDVHRGANVAVFRYDEQLAPEKLMQLGQAPVSVFLHPGLYRVTIDDGELSLCTSSLIEPGAADTVEMNKPSNEIRGSLVQIPGGIYALGKSDSTFSLDRPRQVKLSSFGISRTEVSNREYREYVVATKGRAPETWSTPYDSRIDELPVTDITWDEANAYCRWRGVRLPTPDEWEVAAQGPGNSPYPWHKDNKPEMHRIEVENQDVKAYLEFARPVNSDPELATHRDVRHMLSNVQEYTEGIAANRNGGIVVKGRCWFDSPFRKSSDMFILSSRSVRSFTRGFRIVANLNEGKKNDEENDHPNRL